MNYKTYADHASMFSNATRGLGVVSDWWKEGESGFPLTVVITESEGFRRELWPVGFPLSLPKGVLCGEGQTLVLTAGDVSLSSQVEVFTHWPDGSAQHLRVLTMVDIEPLCSLELRLTGVRSMEAPGVAAVLSGDIWRVDTGPAQFMVDSTGHRQIIGASRGGEFISQGGQAACWAGVIDNAITGNRHEAANCSGIRTRLIENGEVRTVVLKEVLLSHDAKTARLATWIVFHTGQPWVRLYSWVEFDDYGAHPMVASEIAFHADFKYEGSPIFSQESRFGRASEGEVVEAVARDGIAAQVVLPWLRELGMASPSNLTCRSVEDRLSVEWRPIDSGTEGQSPMNSPCWVARYWREAALVLADIEHEPDLARAVKGELELQGLSAKVRGLEFADMALQEILTVPSEVANEVAQLAEGQSAVRLSKDYPSDGIDGQEWHNWESAYFHGFGWRNVFIEQKKAFGPRGMKCDGLRLLQYQGSKGSPLYGRQVRLQARAWPVNLAPDRMQWGFGFCDIGYYGKSKLRGHYSVEVSHTTPEATNVAYAGRLIFHLFEMWCRTGEPMLKESFDRLYRKTQKMLVDGIYSFDGDRPWIFLRDLVRLYQFTEDPVFLKDIELLLARLPKEMEPTAWNINYQCRLWNNETYALVYRLLGGDKLRRFHEGQMESYLADAQAHSADETLILPMAKTLPPDMRWGLLAAQLMTGFAAWANWEESGKAEMWYEHFWKVVQCQLLVSSPVWRGLHYRLYTEDTYRSPSWFDRSAFQNTLSARGLGWDTDYAESNHAPGELFRAFTLSAANLVPYHFHLTEQEMIFWVDPARPARSIEWPDGKLRISRKTDASIAIEATKLSGELTILLPGRFRVSDSTISSASCDLSSFGPERKDLTIVKINGMGSFLFELKKIPSNKEKFAISEEFEPAQAI